MSIPSGKGWILSLPDVPGNIWKKFLKIADSDKYVNVLDTFFKVGFRSKATALRNFKEYTGMLPSEYLQLKLKQKTKMP